PVEGWTGDCSCPQEFDCEHIFAAMRALLAEHSTAAVRSLSAGVASISTSARSGQKLAQEPASLARRLMVAVGRPLNTEETKFLTKVHAVYKRCCQNQFITAWDFHEMGLRIGGSGW